MEIGDIVLVCFSAFKGHHKMQDQWENKEYVMERWPYPKVPVYVVCPRDEEGCSWTLHGDCNLPISSNVEQARDDTPVAGVDQMTTSAPVISVDSEPADSEPSRMVMSHTTGNTYQGSQDQPAPLRFGTCATQNQLPWWYCKFALLVDISLSSILDVGVSLCICLHLISCIYTIFMGSIV